MREEIKKEVINQIASANLDNIYPVGTIFTSTTLSTANDVKNALGGGTWEPYGEGRVLIGKAASGTFNTIGKTGGEETHQLTQSELPRVTGTIDLHSGGSGTTNSAYLCYRVGIQITGNGASAFKAALPNSSSSPYRKLF